MAVALFHVGVRIVLGTVGGDAVRRVAWQASAEIQVSRAVLGCPRAVGGTYCFSGDWHESGTRAERQRRIRARQAS